MKIKNILNNSALIAVGSDEQEKILVGKGISFGKHPNDEVDESKIEKVFNSSTSKSTELLELLNDIPEKYFELTATIVRYVQKKLDTELDKNIFITLTDHINSAFERYQEGIFLDYGMLNELKQLFPKEYKVSQWSLDYINAACDVDLPADECGFLAMHIINATAQNDNFSFAKKVMVIVKDITDIVLKSYDKVIDQEGLHYSRFITHLKYLAIRYFKHIENEKDSLFVLNKDVIDCVEPCLNEIDQMMTEKHGHKLSPYEKQYLVLHLYRLIEND